MKLAVYVKTCSRPQKQVHLLNFAEGARRNGVDVIEDYSNVYQPSDYGVIFGYKDEAKNTKKSSENARIVLYKSYPNKNVFFIDSDVLGHYNKPRNVSSLRYSLKSIYPNEADYFLDDLDVSRWDKFNINMKDWRTNRGDKIILLLNRGKRGFSSKGLNSFRWAYETIRSLRDVSDRTIVLRPHNINNAKMFDPEDEEWKQKIFKEFKNIEITFWEDQTLEQNLNQAWATVSYTSTASAVSLIEGIPTFVTGDHSYLKEYSAGNIVDIENPKFVDRESFKHKYSNSHWTNREIETGVFWRKISQYL